MSKKLNIGLLLVEDGDFWGGMNGLYEHYSKRFATCSPNINIVPLDAINGTLPTTLQQLQQYNGFIITGSNYSVNDGLPWMQRLEKWVDVMFRSGIHRLFGICFGHQLIAKSLGCQVGRNVHSEDVFGTFPVTIHNALQTKQFFNRVFGFRREVMVMEAHGESVLSVPAHLKCQVLGSSETCQYEVVAWSDNIVSMQGHPEFDVDVMENRIAPMAREHGFLTDQQIGVAAKTFTDVDANDMVRFVASFFDE